MEQQPARKAKAPTVQGCCSPNLHCLEFVEGEEQKSVSGCALGAGAGVLADEG